MMDWQIGNGLADWYWICGLVMDGQLGIELALNWRIGHGSEFGR